MATQVMVSGLFQQPDDLGNPPGWYANQAFKVRAQYYSYNTEVGQGPSPMAVTVSIPFDTSSKKALDLVRNAIAAQASIDLGVMVTANDIVFCEFLPTITIY